MEYTTNYNLKKPGDQDNVLVGALNENMDKVDTTMKALSAGKANLDPDTGKVPDNELPDDLFLKLAGGAMKGVINMANYLIKGLPDPAEDGDAARKAYVDALRTYLDTGGFAKIQAGFYTGTGANSASLTASFPIKAMFIYQESAVGSYFYQYAIVWIGQARGASSNSYYRSYTVTNGGKTVSWTSTGPRVPVLNSSGQKYHYVLIG